MFNAEVKTEFIRQYTTDAAVARSLLLMFNRLEPYEVDYGGDICTMPVESAQLVIDKEYGRSKSRSAETFIALKKYSKWAIHTGVPGACDGLANVKDPSAEYIKERTVSGPKHLSICLDQMLLPAGSETMDDIYRCFIWLAFFGIPAEDAVEITTEEVDIRNLCITHNNKTYTICQEALPEVRNATTLNQILYIHENPHYERMRDRVPGNKILRGLRRDIDLGYIRGLVGHKVTLARRAGKLKVQLGYTNVWRSGLFYRMYENERAGLLVDFRDAAIQHVLGDNDGADLNAKFTPKYIANTINKLTQDYNRWKLAYSI